MNTGPRHLSFEDHLVTIPLTLLKNATLLSECREIFTPRHACAERGQVIYNYIDSEKKIETQLHFNTGRLLFEFKGARYLLIIHEVLVAMDFFSVGVQDETLEEESQRLAS